jgi:hypothetical protein
LRESVELAVGITIEKKWQEGIRLCEEDFIVYCSYSEPVIRFQDTTSGGHN